MSPTTRYSGYLSEVNTQLRSTASEHKIPHVYVSCDKSSQPPGEMAVYRLERQALGFGSDIRESRKLSRVGLHHHLVAEF